MKFALVKLGIFLLYIMLMLAVLKFDIMLIINIKMLSVVLLGTVLLTLLDFFKGISMSKLIEGVRSHLIITGFMATFISQISLISRKPVTKNIYFDILTNFLPVFYAFTFYLIMDQFVDSNKFQKARIKHTFERPELKEGDLVSDAMFPADRLQLKQSIENLTLTRKELLVVKELFSEYSNKEIADRLFITESTLKKHLHNVYTKAEVRNRTEFVHNYKE